MSVFIIRHRKENRKKCSLTPLESDNRFQFIIYPFKKALPSFDQTILLTLDAPEITPQDKHFNLLLVDATWRYAQKMQSQLPNSLIKRSIPAAWKTAYPRKQEVEHGLASIEALFAAFTIFGLPAQHLLDHYYWKEAFLEKNRHLLLD